jgi:hypothetical protein
MALARSEVEEGRMIATLDIAAWFWDCHCRCLLLQGNQGRGRLLRTDVHPVLYSKAATQLQERPDGLKFPLSLASVLEMNALGNHPAQKQAPSV